MKSLLIASIFLLIAPIVHAADAYEVAALGAWTAMPGSGHIGETDAHLRLEPRLGAGLSLGARLSDRVTADLIGSMTLLPVSLRAPGEKDHGRVIRMAPVSLTLLADMPGTERWQPYVGGGIFLPLVRRALDPAGVSTVHVTRVEQPDHGAVLLQTGIRYAAGSRWSIVGDVKYDPVWSTLEVHAAELPRAQQTNFHPLIVSTGVAARF